MYVHTLTGRCRSPHAKPYGSVIKEFFLSAEMGRPDASVNDADPGRARDVRIHDFPITRWIWRKLRALTRRRRAAKQRRQLGGLSEHLLRDLGLTERDVRREACKTFWYM